MTVKLVDCTFQTMPQAIAQVKQSKPQVIGIYSMFSMKKTSFEIARQLRGSCDLLVAGGPLPTLDPTDFLDVFDVVAVGEGEETLVELADCVEKGLPVSRVKGVAFKESGSVKFSPSRGFVEDLDAFFRGHLI